MVEQLTYESFGNQVASSRTRYTYTGRERDADTDLMYYRARFYDPQVGRFIGEDPIGLNGGINPYAYAANDPAALIDPSGLVQQGPQNYLRDPFSYNHWVAKLFKYDVRRSAIGSICSIGMASRRSLSV